MLDVSNQRLHLDSLTMTYTCLVNPGISAGINNSFTVFHASCDASLLSLLISSLYRDRY